jgi:hypothetical protein
MALIRRWAPVAASETTTPVAAVARTQLELATPLATPVAALEATAPVAAEAVERRYAATIFVNSLARNSVRVCTIASLIRPICLRETLLPSPHRSRRLTAKDRKEALGCAKPTRAIRCKSITVSTPLHWP